MATDTAPLILVLGAGPGLGLSVARRFGAEGYAAALVGGSAEQMQPLVETLAAEGIAATAHGVTLTDPDDVRRVVTEIGEQAGRIDVLHFNPSAWRQIDPMHLTVAELFEDLGVGVAPLLPAVQAARPFLAAGARVLATGSAAADKPWNEAASLGVQKAAVRNLVTSLEATLAPDGIHAVCVQVNGVLGEGAFTPPLVADALYAATTRPDEGWTAQVAYDG
jgi:NAD(P)-dependent dehydrogenase (short-subunit alcohol dehydrogenase family)